jgi:hypothetical protein
MPSRTQNLAGSLLATRYVETWDFEPWGRPYGSEEYGGFNELSKSYKENPSIEQYVKLRRENPDAEIEISVMGGLDPLFAMEPELKKYGFDPDLVACIMDAAPDAQKELSLQFMELRNTHGLPHGHHLAGHSRQMEATSSWDRTDFPAAACYALAMPPRTRD